MMNTNYLIIFLTIIILLIILFLLFLLFMPFFDYNFHFDFNSKYFYGDSNFSPSLKEGLLSKSNKNIVLLGDSILYNNSFVKKGNSVQDFLEKNKNKNITIYNYAENEETINGIYQQLSKINSDLNSENTTLFLSVGGNDILQMSTRNATIKTLFESYKTLIKAIKTKLPIVNLILLNIYQPIKAPEYSGKIQEWNTLLNTEYGYFSILDLTKILYKHNDFTHDIEPSPTGGEKISNKILRYLA